MSDLLKALRRLKGLSAAQRKVLVQAAALLPWVHALQQALPFRWWRSYFARDAQMRDRRGLEADVVEPSVQDIAASVEVARKWLPGRYLCLPSAYTVHLLLHRHGYPSEVHVGVRRDSRGKVEAHAWVTCQGETVMGAVDDLASFIELPQLPLGTS